eukprot:859810-Alexandrium_andersonii.AAC.1
MCFRVHVLRRLCVGAQTQRPVGQPQAPVSARIRAVGGNHGINQSLALGRQGTSRVVAAPPCVLP